MRPRGGRIRAAASVAADLVLAVALAILVALLAGCGGAGAQTARTVATHVVKAACTVCEHGSRLLEEHAAAELSELETCTPELAEELEEVAEELEELGP